MHSERLVVESFANFRLTGKARFIICPSTKIQRIQLSFFRLCVVGTGEDFFVQEAMAGATFSVATTGHLKWHICFYPSLHHVCTDFSLNVILIVLLIDDLESNFAFRSRKHPPSCLNISKSHHILCHEFLNIHCPLCYQVKHLVVYLVWNLFFSL